MINDLYGVGWGVKLYSSTYSAFIGIITHNLIRNLQVTWGVLVMTFLWIGALLGLACRRRDVVWYMFRVSGWISFFSGCCLIRA